MPFFSRSKNRESEKTQQTGPESLNKSLSSAENAGHPVAPQQQPPIAPSGSLSLGNEQSGIEVSFDGQNADQLEGSVGLFQGVKNIFGATDTFSKVQQTLELYQGEMNPEKKELKRQEAIQLGEQFLRENKKAQNLKDTNTLKKCQSVERIVEKLQKEHIVVDKLDKKVTVGAKLSAFFTGTESTFSLIDKTYSTYLNLSSKPINTIPGLIQVLSAGADLVGLMNTWEEKHGKETSKEALSKKSSIRTIRDNLGAMSVLIKATEYLSIQASGITIDCFNMASESVLIPLVRLDVRLGEGKNFQAEANNVILSKSGAVLSNARFSYTGEMNFADVITISNINGSINTVGKDQYDFNLAGTLAVDTGDSNVAQITTSGKASALYHGASSTSEVIIEEGHISLVVGNDFNMELNGLSFQEGVLMAEETSLVFHYHENEFTGDVAALRLSHDAVDWNEAMVAYSGRIGIGDVVGVTNPTGKVKGSAEQHAVDLSGNVDFSALSGNIGSIRASGTVGLFNSGVGTPMKTALTGGAVEGTIANILKIKAEGIDYSEADGLTATAASLLADLGAVGKLEGAVKGLSINNDGVDWEEATLMSDKQIGFENIATISNLSGHILGSSGNYAKVLKGHVRFNPKVEGLGNIEASGEIEAEQNSNAAPWTFAIVNGSLNADLFGFMHIEESNLGYSDGEMTLEAPLITLSGNVPGFLNGFSVKGSEIVIGNGRIDWANIEIGLGKTFEPAPGLSAKLPNLLLYGSAGNYNMEFRDAEASLSVGDAFSAQGGLSMRYDRTSNQMQIMSAALNLSGKSPEIPGNIPGVWPFNFNFIFSLIPAGIPAEAGIGIYANGSVSAGVEGKVRYDESTPGVWYLTGRPNLAGKIAFGVKASAGMGSQLLIYLGVYLAAEAEATAKGSVDLSTEIVMNEQSFGLSMEQSKATYEIEADLRALLKGGVEARALYFFGATLYEVVFKEWHIGHTSMSGDLSLTDGKATQNSASGIFSGNKDALQDPAKSGAIRTQTKASSNALNALAKAQEILGNSGNSAEIKAFLGIDGVAKEQEFMLIKQKVVQSFQDSIKEVLKAKDFAEKELKTKRGPVEAEISKLTEKLKVMKQEGKVRIAGDWFGTISKEELEAKIVAKRTELSTFDILEARAINARNELNEIKETYGNLEQLLLSRSSDLTGMNFAQEVLNQSEMLAEMNDGG